MAMVMPRDALVHINGNRLSDHARSDVERTPIRIEHSVRTARGTLRKNHVADKWSFSVSWSRLPETDAKTIDGFWGAAKIIDFYKATPGEFEFYLAPSSDTPYNASTSIDDDPNKFRVVFTDFSYTVVARFDEYYYDLSFSVEEV